MPAIGGGRHGPQSRRRSAEPGFQQTELDQLQMARVGTP